MDVLEVEDGVSFYNIPIKNLKHFNKVHCLICRTYITYNISDIEIYEDYMKYKYKDIDVLYAWDVLTDIKYIISFMKTKNIKYFSKYGKHTITKKDNKYYYSFIKHENEIKR